MEINSFFKKYKNIHTGKEAILFATGPSLAKFPISKLLTDKILLGVNGIVNNTIIRKHLDYYFFGDCDHPTNPQPYLPKVHELPKHTQKFACVYIDGYQNTEKQISPEEARNYGAHAFDIFFKKKQHTGTQYHWKPDISTSRLDPVSVTLEALQFLLYTGVKKIHLVGVDCGGGHHFYDNQSFWGRSKSHDGLIGRIELMNQFAKEYFSAELVVVNSCGLKNILQESPLLK